MTTRVAIFIYDEVEVLDFAGPFEVFSTAARVKARIQPDIPQLFDVFTVAETSQLVQARGGLLVQPAYDFKNHPLIDVLIIPGGVVSSVLKRVAVLAWIKKCTKQAQISASVCTGTFLLAKAGVLINESITTHWEDIAEFRLMFPGIEVRENVRWVDAGKVVTSAGISAGIDMSLHLVARLEDEELARRTARQMEFDWQKLTG